MQKLILGGLAGLLLLGLGLAPTRALALNVGYYDMNSGQGNASQLPSIATAGETPVNITDPSAANLAGIDILYVQNPSNGGYGGEYLSRLADIQAAVSGGMVLIIHDRYVDGAEAILPGGAGFNVVRNFDNDADINILDNSTLVTNGPGGVVDNTTLDGGSSSSHGYTDAASLPGSAVLLLSTTVPTRIVTFAYPFGSGWVIYSTIPLDHYLAGSGSSGVNAGMQKYAANIVAYAADLHSPDFLTVAPASGPEDSAIPLAIARNADFPGIDEITIDSVVIGGVPAGASLNAGIETAPGVWTLTEAQLDGLTFLPTPNSNVDVALTVTGNGRDALDTPLLTVLNLAIDLIGVADDPGVDTGTAFPFGRPAVPISIAFQPTDTDSSETLAVTIANVPATAVLSAGVDLGGGTWQLTPADLAGLKMTVPAWLQEFIAWKLEVTVTVTENDGDTNVVSDQLLIVDLSTVRDDQETPQTADVVSTSGGCTLGGGNDTLLPLLLLGAAGWLLRRRWNR